ncbi:MAG: hypothetical protein P4L98_11665 [Ancalomicrobiaceae bacterium]|nr:hypothetical protein [Ancalomicrobiaceae bacterium]
MRSEWKMIFAGFAAGAVIGLVALTSVNASIGTQHIMRSDRLAPAIKPPITFGDIDPASVVSHVELIGPKGTIVEFRDPAGKLVYRSDPVTNTTIVAKNTVIPSFTVKEKAGDVAELKLVNTAGELPVGQKAD